MIQKAKSRIDQGTTEQAPEISTWTTYKRLMFLTHHLWW